MKKVCSVKNSNFNSKNHIIFICDHATNNIDKKYKNQFLHKNILDDQHLEYLYSNVIPSSWYKEDINIAKKKFSKYTKSNSDLAEFLQRKFFNKPIKVLDYGSGEVYYKDLKGKISYSTYDLADKHSKQATNTSLMDLKNKQYDLIFLNQILEHAKNPYEIIKSLENVLSPGGIIKIENPSSSFVKFKILLLNAHMKIRKDLIEDIFPLEHINCISNRGMRVMTKNFKYMPFLTAKCYFVQNKGLKAVYKYLSINLYIFRLLSSLLTNKNGGHYIVLKKIT